MPLESVEDINIEVDETNTTNERFKESILYFKKRNPNGSCFQHCRNAILRTFMYDWLYVAIVAIVSECTGIYYAFFIEYLANFIIDKHQPTSKGIWLIAIYLCMNFVTIVGRNRYI